jgi:L-ribulose-5-phosphate 3-epimerase
MKLGIVAEALGVPLRQALSQTARLGVGGVEFDAVGDLAPDRLTDTGRRELRNLLKGYNLELTALNCPLRRGIDAAEDQQARLEHVRKVMALSFDLGPRVTIVQCPAIPTEPESERAKLLHAALLALGQHGDRTGVTLALEIGLDPAEKVRDYLNGIDVGSLKVNYDPANMLRHGHDPVQSLLPLHGKIVHTHARDVRMATVSRVAQEVPLGGGDIDWLSCMAMLSAIEYRGWVVAARQTGANLLADVQAAVQFLRRVLVP